MQKYPRKFLGVLTLLLVMIYTVKFPVSSAFADNTDTALRALSGFLDGKSPTEIAVGVVKDLAQDFIFDKVSEWWNSDPNTTALFKAVVEPKTKPQEIRALVAKGAKINAKYKGCTPLMYAVLITPDPNVISTLIELGANVNDKDDSKFTALVYAALKNTNPEITATLIRHGADVSIFNAKQEKSDMTLFGDMMWDKETEPNHRVIRELLRSGVDVNSSRNHHGLTILMHEMYSDKPNIETIKTLIDGGADVNAKDKDERTALMWALEYKDNLNVEVTIQVLRELINGGADVNAQDEDGETALMKTNNLEIIRELIKAGANVNLQDRKGKTALMRNISAPQVIKEFLKAGADVNAQDEDDWTALMYAAKNGIPSVVRELLSAGADAGIKGDDWFIFSVTALDLAKERLDRLKDKNDADKSAAQEIVELLEGQQGFFGGIFDSISGFFGEVFRFIVIALLIAVIGYGIFYWQSYGIF